VTGLDVLFIVLGAAALSMFFDAVDWLIDRIVVFARVWGAYEERRER